MQFSISLLHHSNKIAVLFLLCSVSTSFAESSPVLPEHAIQVQSGSENWVDAQGKVPGMKIAILEGDPTKEGLFTIRLKIPAGYLLKPHWHATDERVTVLSGKALVGFGDTFDALATTALGEGSFYVNPANVHHYVQFPVATTVQITGVGPWQLTFVEQDKAK